MFFLFARSLTERELQIKLTSMPVSFDITQLKINKKKVLKIAKVYFENIAGETEQAKTTAENLANHFLTSLIKGAQETQEMENELYDKLKGDIQVTFFQIKLLREFQTQQLRSSAASIGYSNHQQNNAGFPNSNNDINYANTQHAAYLQGQFEPIVEQNNEHMLSTGAVT